MHIAKGTQHQTNTDGFNRPSQIGQASTSQGDNHCIPAAKQPFRVLRRWQKNQGKIPNKHWAQLKTTRQLSVVFGPNVAKTTQPQPKPGYLSSHKHTMKDNNKPQSQNREIQPTTLTIPQWNSWAISHSPQTEERTTPSVDRREHIQRIGNPQWSKMKLEPTANKTHGNT